MPIRLLVVDDERAQCALLENILTNAGYEVDSACDSQSAIELLNNNKYRLAIFDYQMPDMNGISLFNIAKQIQPKLIGLFLTAYTDINTVFPALDAGVERVLPKPADARELLPLINQLVGGQTIPTSL